jgi:hypothetical protein
VKISIEHHQGRYPSFNVGLSSAEGKEPFLVIKGCRIVDGKKGRFVSWPARKNENDGKVDYWNHVWASDAFMQAVIAEADKPAKQEPPPRSRPLDAPF